MTNLKKSPTVFQVIPVQEAPYSGTSVVTVVFDWDELLAIGTYSNLDVFQVSNGKESGMYQYRDTIDGIAFNGFLPYHLSIRITELQQDASANKAYIDYLAGDDIATISGRGWSVNGSASDGTDGLVLPSSSGTGRNVVFTSTYTGDALIYIEHKCLTLNASSGVLASGFQYNPAGTPYRFCADRAGTMGRSTLTGYSAGVVSRGEADILRPNSFDYPIYFTVADEFTTLNAPELDLTTYKEECMTYKSNYAANAGNPVSFFQSTISGCSMEVRRLFAFKLNPL